MFAIYSHLDNKEAIGISYYLNGPPLKIYDSENTTSKLGVYERKYITFMGKDSSINEVLVKEIEENVYLISGVLWNSGNKTIKSDDVRIPITLSTGNGSRILDFRINQEKDSIVAGFKLSQSSANSVELDWDYFDPNYGFSFQIITIGKNTPGLLIDGKLRGIANFKEIRHKQKLGYLDVMTIVITVLLIAFLSYLLKTRYLSMSKFLYSFAIVYLIILVILTIASIYLFIEGSNVFKL